LLAHPSPLTQLGRHPIVLEEDKVVLSAPSNGQPAQLPPVKSYSRIPQVLEVPNLIQGQIQSYEWFTAEALREVFKEISPIVDYTGKKYELHFQEHHFGPAKYSAKECKEREINYSQPLYVRTRLVMKETGEIKEQQIFMGDIPVMTINGTFIINGAERVVVSQLVRSPGVYFVYEKNLATDRNLCYAKLIPSRGAWLEFETSAKDILSVKVDRKRKVSATAFLRALGVASDEEMLDLFKGVDTDEHHRYIRTTLDRDVVPEERELSFREDDLRAMWQGLREGHAFNSAQARRMAAAQIEFYRRLRPGEPPSLENAKNLVRNLFFDGRRYDLGRVGRYKLNRRLTQTDNAAVQWCAGTRSPEADGSE
jgi:DNA-directed RNA polymerase subunit beta